MMPIARFEMPDGRIARFEVPDGTTPEQAQAMMASYDFSSDAEAAAPPRMGREMLGTAAKNAATHYVQDEIAEETPAQPKYGVLHTALEQGAQGITANYGDEIMDWVGASYAKNAPAWMGGRPDLMRDVDPNDLFAEAQGMSQERLNRQLQERPVLSIASNIVGGLGTGAAGLTTKTGSAIANSLRAGNTAKRIAKGAGLGSATGAAMGYGAGTEGTRDERAAGGAVLGATLGGAFPAAAAGINRLNTKTIIPGADEVRQAASQMYKRAEQFGGTLKPEFTNKFIKEADSILLSKDPKIRGSRTHRQLVDAFDDLAQFANEPMTLQRAQELDEMLGEMINQRVNLNGTLNDQGRKLYNAQTTLRRMIETADESVMSGSKEGFEALKEGRKLWSTSRKLDDIERIISRAEMTDNPATAIKTGFRNLFHSKRIAGYSPQEAKAIEKAANSGVVGDLLRTAGSRLAPIITAGAGGGIGSTAAAAAASMAARGAATRGQLKRAQDVSRAVAERSGMVQQQQRIPLRELAKLPPREAQRYLNRNSQK